MTFLASTMVSGAEHTPRAQTLCGSEFRHGMLSHMVHGPLKCMQPKHDEGNNEVLVVYLRAGAVLINQNDISRDKTILLAKTSS